MAVKEETSKVIYTLNATAERFPIPFDTEKDDYGDAENIDVYLGTVMLERGKDFLIESNTVIYKDAVNHGGEQLTVLRNTPVKQDIDFVDNGSFSLEDIERMGDNAVRILQELKTNVGDTINAQFSADRASASASSASVSAASASESAAEAKTSETNAGNSASSASVSAASASESAAEAKTSETNAGNSASSALSSATSAGTSANEASASAINAKTSEDNAKTSETNAKDSEDNAKTSEQNAKASEQSALQHSTSSSASATAAALSSASASESAHDSEAYAVGTRGGTPVSSADETYNNNSKYYYNLIKQQITGGIPIGVPTLWMGEKPDWAIDFGNGASTQYAWGNYPQLDNDNFKSILTTLSNNGWMEAYDEVGFYVPDLRGIVPIGYGTNAIRTSESCVGGSLGAYSASTNKAHTHNTNWRKNTGSFWMQRYTTDPVTGVWKKDLVSGYNFGDFDHRSGETTNGYYYYMQGSVPTDSSGSSAGKPSTIGCMWIIRFE